MEAVLIIGGHGQLGRCLSEQLEGTYTVTSLAKPKFDLLGPEDLRNYLDSGSYRAVVNCAAYTAVDKAESEPDLALQVNAEAVEAIASICHEFQTPLIHISTDYVYDNDLRRPLVESDPLHPRSVYAKTKLEGERAAQMAHDQTYVLRTSWVFSEYGKNFVRTMLALAHKGIQPKVVSDQVGSPTYARDLATAIQAVIKQTGIARPGVYNFCNAGQTTWHRFAQEIFAISGDEVRVTAISTEEFGAAAPRPAYSVLDTSLFASTFGIIPRPWQDALADCIARLSEEA